MKSRTSLVFAAGISLALLAACDSPMGAPAIQRGTSDPKGFVFQLAEYQISVAIPAGAYSQGSPAELQASKTQFAGLAAEGFDISPNGVSLDLDTRYLVDGKSLEIRLGFKGKEYNAERTMLVVENESGVPVCLDESFQDGILVAQLDTRMLRFLDQGTPGREKILIYYVHQPAADSLPRQDFSSRIKTWSNGAWADGAPATPLAGKRVALLVHGLASSASDLKELADYLDKLQPRQYDALVAFEYSSSADIGTIGDAMATSLYPVLEKTKAVDLFAHSLGNLVSRRGMAGTSAVKGLDPLIRRFIGMGGPQNGVPFGMKWTEALTYILVRCHVFKGSITLVRDLCTEGIDGTPVTDFQVQLRKATPRPRPVLTISGDNWSSYGVMGYAFEALYVNACGFSPPDQDGIVARYSAQSPAAMKSWASPWTQMHFSKTHRELCSEASVLAEIGKWLLAFKE